VTRSQTAATKKAASELDQLDRKLLNIIQSSFPLVEEPFADIGRSLGIPEPEVIERIQALKDTNLVRQISAIFDTRRLGYKTVLVAMRYPPDKLDKGARFINQHPGVSHNYARNGHFNLWFTLAVPPNESLDDTVRGMAERTGAEAYRLMPTIRFFKIGVNFDMLSEEGAAHNYSPDGYAANGAPGAGWNTPQPVSAFDIQVIRELQEDLPLEHHPFAPMAGRLGITQQELFRLADDFQKRAIMRRYSAVLHHRKAGFKANAMAVWRVPEERAVEVGNTMAKSRWVTHCYQRPTFPDWKYTHFTMIHATSKEQCEEVAKDISHATGIDDYLLLYSTREYKKTRVRYFV
jgi:DNA-binding Lrp family transcriptional regulator